MLKNISYWLLLPVFIVFTSCGTGKYGIKKSWSFYKVNTPGTIAVDDNGNEMTPRRDTVREIYIVTKKISYPVVDAVFINGKYYTSAISKIVSGRVYVGERLPDNKRVELKEGKRKILWKIVIGELIKEQTIKDYQAEPLFYIAVRINNKGKLYEIKSSVELVPDLHY